VTYKETIKGLNEFDPETGQKNPLIEQATTAAIAPLIQVVGDNYMVDQLGSVLDILKSLSVGNPEYTHKTIKRTVANMVVPAILRQTNKLLVDGTFRKSETYLEMMQQGIPGLSSSLPADPTIWGDDRLYPFSLNPETGSFAYTKSVKQDKYDREIIDLEVNIPSTPSSLNFGSNTRAVDLDVHQRARFGRLRGKGFGNGMPSLKEKMIQVMDSASYRAPNRSDMDKRVIIESVFSAYTQATKQYMFKYDPKLRADFQTNLQELQAERARTQQ